MGFQHQPDNRRPVARRVRLIALRGVVTVATVTAAAATARVQDQPARSDIDRLVERGDVRGLEARLGRSPEDLARIAQAARNQALRARKADEKEQLFADAEKRYLEVVRAIEALGDLDPVRRKVYLCRAYLDLAGMVLSSWAGGDMNTFEISGGRYGDTGRLLTKLRKARGYYEKARDLIGPLFAERDAREDEYLALGVYEDVKRYKLDTDFNLGFANLYLGMVCPPDQAQERAAALETAERIFQGLVDSIAGGTEIFQCHLGLATAMSERRRTEDALRNFDLAMGEGADPVVATQARYEKARCLVGAERFEEARAVLDPLLRKNPDELPPNEAGAKFYIHLAGLWEAYSHLAESRSLARQAAQAAVGRQALELQSRRARELGLSKMQRLAARGGPWPGVVRIWVAASVGEAADPPAMSALELKFAADQRAEKKEYAEAVKLLEAAAAKPDVDPDLLGQILFDLGIAHYRLQDLPAAAARFEQLAAKLPRHAQAAQAATYAYKCRAQIAQESRKPEDYARLAAALGTLLSNFPNHPDREEAAWLLPAAQQSAGQYAEAARLYAQVPKDSPRWEEAQYRLVECAHLACEAQRDRLPPEEYALLARKTAREGLEYSRAAHQRAAGGGEAQKQVLEWSAQAAVSAAELLAAHGVERFADALEALEGFEARYSNPDLMGRVLAVRIRAHRGLGDFEQAQSLLDRYLATVPPDKAGAVLAGMARGMREEVEALRAAGKDDAARRMAGEGVEIFDKLLQSVSANPQQQDQIEPVRLGRARMLYYADRLDEAEAGVRELAERSPTNGLYMQLAAQILTAKAERSPSEASLAAARAAWERLLKVPSLKTAAPQLYWEARYNWLEILFRAGQAADVARAVAQDRVWSPDLGGPPWAAKLEDLHRRAAAAAGLQPPDSPASRPSGPTSSSASPEQGDPLRSP